MKNFRYSKIFPLMVIACTVASTGCGKKQDYETMYKNLVVVNNENSSKLEAMQLALASYDDKYKESVDLSKYTVLDTGARAFQKFKDKVYLDSSVDFGNVDAISNTSAIQLADKISITPSDSWSINLSTSRTDLYNEANSITGDIQVYKIFDSTAMEFIYTKFIEPFVTANNLDVNDKSTVFIGEDKAGVQIDSKIIIKSVEPDDETRELKLNAVLSSEEIESRQEEANKAVQESEAQRMDEYMATRPSDSTEPVPETEATAPDVGTEKIEIKVPGTKETKTDYVLRIGVIMSEDKAILYKFMYPDNDKANASKEIVNNLITSMTFGTKKVSIGS